MFAVPLLAWLAVAAAISYATFAVDPWPFQPLWSDLTAHDLLAAAAALAFAPWVFRRQLELLGRRESRRRRRRSTEIYDAIQTGRLAEDRPAQEVTIGWRWGRITAVTAGFAALPVAVAVFGFPDDPGTVERVFFWTAILAYASMPLLNLVRPAALWPIALRLDGRGIDLVEGGALPWSAVAGCSIERFNNVRFLIVSGAPEAIVPEHLARRLYRPLVRQGRMRLSLLFLDADVAQLALALERFGQRLENPEA